jgi:kumamolisin
MPSAPKRVTIAGSEKQAPAGAKAVGDVDLSEQITVTVVLRRRSGNGGDLLAASAPLSREAFAEQHGADPADVERFESFAHDYGLSIVAVDIGARTIKVSGALADLTAAFRPKLKVYKSGSAKLRGRTGGLSAPADVAAAIEGVFGFDNRPRNAADGSLTTPEIAKLYQFPPALDGTGQTIAIIELGGGFVSKDLTTYFKALKLPKPSVVAVGVDGGRNAPGDPADGEVMLDIEVAGAVAPKAKIAVYFAPNTDQGFLDALLGAVHDNQRKPSVVSISWGAPEDVGWTAQARNAFNSALQDAAALGVTVCCAAGDDGSSDIRKVSDRDGKPHADFPASSPFALSCGGTTLIGTGSTIQSEVTWNEGNRGGATGGGVSTTFAKPAYQANAKVPKPSKPSGGRGVPDVAGNADPATGYRIVLNGAWAAIGGTSAVSPLWAGLVALMNQRLAATGKHPVGFMHPKLYANRAAFRDISQGTNDIDGTLKKYAAGPGWDACTGLGSPNGTKLLAVFEA